MFLALGLIAAHVVDDSFVQPQPGVAATDHLVSGLVPLAVPAVAAVAYPRLRAGWRAVTALLLGVFGLGTGSEAWYYTRQVGASGDNYTATATSRPRSPFCAGARTWTGTASGGLGCPSAAS